MKRFLATLILCFQSISFAMSKETFLQLDEVEKAQWIEAQANEVTEDKDIQNFVTHETNFMDLVMEAGVAVSNIWYDTILEGPYSLEGDIETRVEALYTNNGEVYAVLAVVSSQAFNTDSCEYNEDTEEWADDCISGSISETFVIDSEGNTIDLGYYAEFND